MSSFPNHHGRSSFPRNGKLGEIHMHHDFRNHLTNSLSWEGMLGCPIPQHKTPLLSRLSAALLSSLLLLILPRGRSQYASLGHFLEAMQIVAGAALGANLEGPMHHPRQYHLPTRMPASISIYTLVWRRLSQYRSSPGDVAVHFFASHWSTCQKGAN